MLFELKIVKNTLPYIMPYSIIASTITANMWPVKSKTIGNYKNKAIAEKAKSNFENLLQNGIIPNEIEDHADWPSSKRTSLDPEGMAHTKPQSVINYFTERLKNPQGDSPPKVPPSKKRKIIL